MCARARVCVCVCVQERDAKMRYNHGAYGNKSGGYTAQGVESVGRAGTMSDGSAAAAPADLVENYVLRGRPEQWGAAPDTPGVCVRARACVCVALFSPPLVSS